MGKNDQFYAVARGRQIGVYQSWNECKKQTDKFHGARFKKFSSESEARKFIAENGKAAESTQKSSSSSSLALRKRKHQEEKGSEGPLKRAKQEDIEVDLSEFQDAPVVYTDGACSSNGRANAKAGWGVYWGEGSEDNDCRPVYGAPTNNRGELIAVEKAMEKAIQKNLKKLVIKTDSNLLIQSMDKWIKGWKRNGWKTSTGSDVLNKDILLKLDGLRQKLKVKFIHVRGHAGIDGNEKADELARRGAQMYKSP